MSRESEKIASAIRHATQRPTILDTLLNPIRKTIYSFMDNTVLPQVSRSGDNSGKRFIYVDPRIPKSRVQ
jgi:hypothetical protein